MCSSQQSISCCLFTCCIWFSHSKGSTSIFITSMWMKSKKVNLSSIDSQEEHFHIPREISLHLSSLRAKYWNTDHKFSIFNILYNHNIPGPWFVSSSIIFWAWCDFNVVIKFNNLKIDMMHLCINNSQKWMTIVEGFFGRSRTKFMDNQRSMEKLTFLFFRSSTDGLKLSFLRRYLFFSSRSRLISSLEPSRSSWINSFRKDKNFCCVHLLMETKMTKS